MFSCCFKRQNTDDDEYRQRPKTRNTSSHSSSQIPVHTVRTNEGSEANKSLKQLQTECLAAHNKYRTKHGASPLTLNKQMCSYATEWAKHLAKTNSLQHRKNNKYGENLYMGSGMGPQTHELAVQAWYDEIKNYNFNKPGFSPNNGHFTQVVWKTSKELGVGIETKDNRTWIVCNYDPPGNLMGSYGKCVPPLIEETVSKIIDKMKPKKRPSKTTIDKSDTKASTYSAKDLKLWSQFQLECLDSHNKFRALHGSPAMKLERMLCDLAQDWAKHLAKKGSLSHRPKNNYGENIYYAMNFNPSAEDCVKSWYDEIKNYNFSRPGFSSQTGHFTQVVWRDSVELGVGISKLNNTTFVVCNYSPAGNIMNEYKGQVPRPGEKPSSTNNILKGNENNNNGKQQGQQQQSFEEVCLNSHNDFRAIHGSPAMTLNKNLNFFANDWAQHLAKNNKFETRKNNRFGENIYYAKNEEIEGQDPVEYWYSGIKDYNYNRPQYTAATGGFTQVIWKSSLQLGVGVAHVGRSTYVVCNYNPRGNILNQFAENVLPVGGENVLLMGNNRAAPSQVDEFAVEILKIHNVCREKHGCPPLELSQELMDYSLSYANLMNMFGISMAIHFLEESEEHIPLRQLRDNSNVLHMPINLFVANFRVSKDLFVMLLETLEPMLKPAFRCTQIRSDIKLATFLRFLATGSYQRTLGNENISSAARASVGRIIAEYLPLFEEWICPKWIAMPTVEEEREIMASFFDRNGFPGIIGCVDGTHIRIKSPGAELSPLYFNRKGYHSLNAMVQLLENKTTASEPKYAVNSLILEDDMPSPNLIVNNWYNEIKNYDFENPGYIDNAKHFTQIIWKNTKFLGVAKSSREGKTAVVLCYEPPGNIKNQYAENIPTPII